MPRRIAASCAILAFALCLVIGGFSADNPFSTTVVRALVAMAGTFMVGLLIGVVAERMLQENLLDEEKKLKNPPQNPAANDR